MAIINKNIGFFNFSALKAVMYKGKDIIAMACSCSFENTPLLLFIGINLKKIGFLKIQFLGLKVYSSYFKVPKMIVIKTMLYSSLIIQKE